VLVRDEASVVYEKGGSLAERVAPLGFGLDEKYGVCDALVDGPAGLDWQILGGGRTRGERAGDGQGEPRPLHLRAREQNEGHAKVAGKGRFY
jgi:hypothetical protein